MKTETIKVYIAEDGERFKNETECRDYEINLHKMKSIQDMYLYPLPENIVEKEQFANSLCYIQHQPEHFEHYKQSVFDEIVVEYLFSTMSTPFMDKQEAKVKWNEYKLFSDKLWDTKGIRGKNESRQYLKKYFRNKIQEPYIRAWLRVINTDEDYREWAVMVPLIPKDDPIKPIALNR